MGQIRFSSSSIPVKSVSDWPVTNSVGGIGGTTGWVDGLSKGVANNAFLTRFSYFFDVPGSAPSLVLRVVLFFVPSYKYKLNDALAT
jgi:hypothetical protein